MAEQNTRNPTPREIVGSKDLRESFKDNDRIRGSWFINGIELHQFEANSPASVVGQINGKTSAHFVTAEIDDGGHLVLIDHSGADILIASGTAYREIAPAATGNVGADVSARAKWEERQRDGRTHENRVLELLGLRETARPDTTGSVRPGFETGRSAKDRQKGRTGIDTSASPQIPSNPTPGALTGSGGLDDGRGRTGTGGGAGETRR